MVYCGKPSTACEACRKKKTKCDADPNGCKQCRNADRACPGYRSPLDLTFRDETPKLIQKAAKRALREAVADVDSSRLRNRPRRNDVSAQADALSVSELQACQHPLPSLLRNVTPCLDDRAKCYFVSNFADGIVFAGDEDFDQASYSTLMQNTDSTLDASFKALSLVCLANHTRCPQLERTSQRQYVEAIGLTNKAIASPSDAIKDATLLSVNFLGLYEVLSGKSKRSMKHWVDHYRGAAALLQLRGDEQFRTLAGCRLFRQARASLIIGCLQWTIRLPDHIAEMSSSYAKRVGLSKWKLRLWEAGLAFNQFRYDVRNEIINDPFEVISGALKLDEPLAELCDVNPPEWQFETVADDTLNPEFVHNGYYHVYPKAWVAGSWNTLRSLRILIHLEIRKTLCKAVADSLFPPHFLRSAWSDQFLRSTEICHKLQADIIASAPQLSGYIDTKLSREPRSAFTLVWPLWTAGVLPTATDDTRAYCGRVLHSIGQKIGHSHAFVLGNMLKGDREPVIWDKNNLI